ncbi:hypothetical protein [Methanobrevibacter sp. DSM 116169]|uniref:hypothetical protein n=1 Tax=Methanobrevibacter sp. DSM 116169 TaxID=3242727 RepID=UPI0038FD2F75
MNKILTIILITILALASLSMVSAVEPEKDSEGYITIKPTAYREFSFGDPLFENLGIWSIIDVGYGEDIDHYYIDDGDNDGDYFEFKTFNGYDEVKIKYHENTKFGNLPLKVITDMKTVSGEKIF